MLFSPSTIINKLPFLLHFSLSSDVWAVFLPFVLLIARSLQHQGFSSQIYQFSRLLLESQTHSSFIDLDNTDRANSFKSMLNVFMMQCCKNSQLFLLFCNYCCFLLYYPSYSLVEITSSYEREAVNKP